MFIILLLFYIIKEKSKIKKYINKILKKKVDLSPKKGENQIKLNNSLQVIKKNKGNNDFKSKEKEETDKKQKFNKKNKSKGKVKKGKSKKKRKRLNSNDYFPPKRKHNFSKRNKNSENILIKESSKNFNVVKPKKENDVSNSEKNIVSSKHERIKTINIINIKNVESKDKNTKNNNIKIEKFQDYLKEYKMYSLNDQQMNDLE